VGTRVDLEADEQVVSDGNELLPGAVGAVSVSGDGVESEVAFELAEDFFVFTATIHEANELAGWERDVGCDGGILVVAVVGIEEIELVVLP